MGRLGAIIVAIAVFTVVAGACDTFSESDGPDASAPDASAGDAASDGSDGASSGTFCSSISGVALCADFDLDNDLKTGWSNTDLMTGGTITKSAVQFLSPPNSFASHAAAGPANGASIGRLVLGFDPQAARTRLKFDFRLNTPSLAPDSRLSIAEFLCYDDSGAAGTWLFYRADAKTGAPSFEVETNGEGVHTTLALPPFDAWNHCEMDAEWDNTRVTISCGGASPTTVGLPAVCSTFENAKLNVGLAGVGTTANIDAFYDNIVFEVNPK